MPKRHASKVKPIVQAVAEKTHGVLTPANAVSAAGIIGAFYGIKRLNTPVGVAISGISFLADFADGKIARATNTSSEFGEALDATGDKIKLGYALCKMWELDLAPKPLMTAVALQNSANAVMTVVDKVQHGEDSVLHASWLGKRAIFMQQAGLGAHVISSHMPISEKGRSRVELAGTVTALCGIGLGIAASTGYARRLKAAKTAGPESQSGTL